jgi:KDO transferase-3
MKPTPDTSTYPIQSSHHNNFEDCRNIMQGAVFIIASGSSAKNFPIEKFAHIPMITMNGAISLFKHTDIKPFFYVCSDTSFSKQQPDLFAEAMLRSQRVALWETHVRQLEAEPTGNLFILKKAPKQNLFEWVFNRNVLIRKISLKKRNIGFSKNLAIGFFDARTVAYLALQVAYHVGFTKVFLVGVDLDQSAGRFYEKNGETQNSPCGLDQHFHTRILPSLKLMSDKVVGDDFAVYNLSNTSRIPGDVIPRVTIDEVEDLLITQ